MMKKQVTNKKDWRQMQKSIHKTQVKGLDRLKLIEDLLKDIVNKIRDQQWLDEDKLNTCMSFTVSLTLQQAFNIQLCPYFSYISHLIRQKGINARVMLKDMGDMITKFQEMIFNSVQKQVEAYRLMEYQDGSQDGEQIGGEELTREEIRGSNMRVQQLSVRQSGTSNPIVFERRIKNN